MRSRWGSRKVLVALVAAGALVVAGCSSDGEDSADGTGGDAATTTTTTAAAAPDPFVHDVVAALASDELEGRDDGTAASVGSQDVIIEQLQAIGAEPLSGSADDPDAYRQTFANGTNVLAVIPGGELADEYVVVGAHYDHLGHDCDGITTEDDICNGATDNAAGVAAALAVGRAIAEGDEAPRRSVLLGFWDREEDDFAGSLQFLDEPPVPLDDVVGYVNFDIQGANLSPALTDVTVMVGAETGGPNLEAAATAAADGSDLTTLDLSLLFGQGRSDHAVFAAAGIPVVFFTDANAPCYHTTGDELEIVDFDKLDQQIGTALRLTEELAATDEVPEYTPDTPAATFEDAQSMLAILQQAEPDFARFSAADEAASQQFLTDLTAIVDAGPDAFDDAAVGTLLQGSVGIVSALSTGECDGFLDG